MNFQVDGETQKDGPDVFSIYATGGSKHGHVRELIGTLTLHEGQFQFTTPTALRGQI